MVPKCALSKSLSLSDAIQENYSKLVKWAGQIARDDSQMSEDLVQDLFLRSLQANSPAIEIENLDSYLYRSLRNSYISGRRRQSLRNETSLEEELISQLGQLSVDPRRSLGVQELLAEICYFVCKRFCLLRGSSRKLKHGRRTGTIDEVVLRPLSLELSICSERFVFPGEVERGKHDQAPVADVAVFACGEQVV